MSEQTLHENRPKPQHHADLGEYAPMQATPVEVARQSWTVMRKNWPVMRAILLVWAVAVWLLLILLPGVEQITSTATAMLHLPNMLIGLALVGAMFAAYNLRSDGHLLWFLGVLLLLAGWM